MNTESVNTEIRAITYPIKKLREAGLAGTLTQSAVARHFEKENPTLMVKKVYSFKMNHQDQAVTVQMQVTKRPVKKAGPIPAGNNKSSHTSQALEILARETEPIKSYAAVDGVDANTACPEPITDPAKLLPESQMTGLPEKTITGTDSFPMVWVPKEAVLVEFGKRDARIVELEKELEDVWPRHIFDKKLLAKFDKLMELEHENTTLKSAIEKFGNGNDFDFNVLAEIEDLKEENTELKAQIEMAGE